MCTDTHGNILKIVFSKTLQTNRSSFNWSTNQDIAVLSPIWTYHLIISTWEVLNVILQDSEVRSGQGQLDKREKWLTFQLYQKDLGQTCFEKALEEISSQHTLELGIVKKGTNPSPSWASPPANLKTRLLEPLKIKMTKIYSKMN